jgi:hypothetical protein
MEAPLTRQRLQTLGLLALATVGRITCTTNHTTTLDVSAFLVTP